MSETILDRIRNFLRANHIEFREVEHEPTFTSEQSAQARGESLEIGAKALLMKADANYKLMVLAAHLKLDSAAVRTELGSRKLRFATNDELMELTGLVPGSVPPFGEPLLPFPLYADDSVGQHVDRMAFNAGSLTNSIVMKASDWARVAKPHRFRFARRE